MDGIELGSNYIDGAFGSAGDEHDVLDPSTGRTVRCSGRRPRDGRPGGGRCPAALPGWARATPGERSGVLLALARELEGVAEELAQAETAQAGKPIRLAREFDVPGSVDNV